MNKFSKLSILIAPWGELKSQEKNDWSGSISLPDQLQEFYFEIGPWGPTIHEKVGPVGTQIVGVSDVSIPPLYKLWDMQAGYRWNGVTGERIKSWKSSWIVFATVSDSDPLVIDIDSGQVLFGFHGSGNWSLSPLAPDLQTALEAICTASNAIREFGSEGYDEDECTFTTEALGFMASELENYFGNRSDAKQFLETLEWSA